MATQTSTQSTPSTKSMKLTAISTPINLSPVPILIIQEVDRPNFYPCRRCLKRGVIGEKMHLILYNPFPNSDLTQSPYAVPSPIFIHSHECKVYEGMLVEGEVPEYLNLKVALRAYDEKDLMIGYAIVDGMNQKESVWEARRLLEDSRVEYLNVYNAGPGCFAVRVEI